MASTLDLALQSIDSSRRFITRKYAVTLDDDYATGGMVVDFTAATNPFYLESNGAPGYGIAVDDPKVKISLVNPSIGGYVFSLVKGSDFTDCLLQIFEQDGAGPLVPISGALPAALTDSVDIFIELTTPVGF
jgi:hypothetical protein